MSDRIPGDAELLQTMQEGGEDAFLALYRRWQAPIFRFALRMLGSRTAAEDVTQEVFMAVIRDSRGYRSSRGSFGSWLYGIARHLILRTIERERASPAPPDAAEGQARIEGLRSPQGDPHDESVRRQRTERLRKAVLSLPVHYREVVVLCELHEMDYAEAAKSLGCSIGTIRSRLHRARSILAERLQSGFAEVRTVGKIAPDGCAV